MRRSLWSTLPERSLLLATIVTAVALLSGLLILPVAVMAAEVMTRIEVEVVDRAPLPEHLPLAANLSTVLAADGTRIAELTGHERREPVTIDEVPQVLIDAVLSVEDDGFYTHPGVDHHAMVRALFSNIAAGGIAEGGSTITQQYVKNALLTPSRTIGRKVREALWAIDLEQRLSKDEILERYLNDVYLGEGVYGFGTAADHYLSKRLDEVTVAEAALLAGAIQAPSRTNPVSDPDRAEARRDMIIRLMQRQGRITGQQADEAIATDVTLDIRGREYEEPAWEDLVKRVLYDARIDLQPAAQAAIGDTTEERIQAIFEGGLQIHTTFDVDAQRQAHRSLDATLTDPESDPLGALITVDHTSGAIHALVLGPRSFGVCPEDPDATCTSTQTNPAVPGLGGSGRQPGSAFKPFVAAAALEQGARRSQSYDAPSGRAIEGCGWDRDDPYAPRNYDDRDAGRIDMDAAMHRSNNVYFVKLARDVGVVNVADSAREHGIVSSSNLDAFAGPDCSIALGSADVFPLEIAVAYGVWANGGERCEPYLIERILDRAGEVLYEHEASCERVIGADTARDMRELLHEPVRSGGTAPVVGREIEGDVWGKTGTTTGYVDAWFVGSTPARTTAAWVGYEQPRAMERVTIGGEYHERVTGGGVPARIFADYVSSLEGRPVDGDG